MLHDYSFSLIQMITMIIEFMIILPSKTPLPVHLSTDFWEISRYNEVRIERDNTQARMSIILNNADSASVLFSSSETKLTVSFDNPEQ